MKKKLFLIALVVVTVTNSMAQNLLTRIQEIKPVSTLKFSVPPLPNANDRNQPPMGIMPIGGDEIPASLIPYAVGQGFNSATIEYKNQLLVLPKENELVPADPKANGFFEGTTLSLIKTKQELFESLSIDVKMSLNTLVFDASGSFSLSQQYKNETNSTYLLYKVFVVSQVLYLPEPKLSEYAKEVARTNKKKFLEDYGDYFIRGYAKGGYFYALYKLNFESNIRKREVEAKFEASYGGGLSGTSVDVTATFKSFLSSVSESTTLDIKYTRLGNYDPIAQTADGILKYGSEFATKTEKTNQIISYLTYKTKDNVALPENITAEDFEPIFNQNLQLIKISKQYLLIEEETNKFKKLQNLPVFARNFNQETSDYINSSIEANEQALIKLKELFEKCKKSPNNCAENISSIVFEKFTLSFERNITISEIPSKKSISTFEYSYVGFIGKGESRTISVEGLVSLDPKFENDIINFHKSNYQHIPYVRDIKFSIDKSCNDINNYSDKWIFDSPTNKWKEIILSNPLFTIVVVDPITRNVINVGAQITQNNFAPPQFGITLGPSFKSATLNGPCEVYVKVMYPFIKCNQDKPLNVLVK